MPICSICAGPKRAEVDSALASGTPTRAVAAATGHSKSAVARHKNTCLAPKLAAAARIVAPIAEKRQDVVQAKAIASGQVAPTVADVLSLPGLVGRLGRSLDRLDSASDEAHGEGSHAVLAALAAQLHRGIETVARLQGLTEGPKAERAPFSITIVLPHSEEPITINATPGVSDRDEVAEEREEDGDSGFDGVGVLGADPA